MVYLESDANNNAQDNARDCVRLFVAATQTHKSHKSTAQSVLAPVSKGEIKPTPQERLSATIDLTMVRKRLIQVHLACC